MAETTCGQNLEKIGEKLQPQDESEGKPKESLLDTTSVLKDKEIDSKKSDKLEESALDAISFDPQLQKWSEAFKAKLFASSDKDGNYFSYMFLDKIFSKSRRCIKCRNRGNTQLPPNDDSLELFVIESGIIGKQNVVCGYCGAIDTVISGDKPELLPVDQRLSIKGPEIRDCCSKINHYEVLHDLMVMLQIAATEDDVLRREKHTDVADFMLQNARKVCEEWCKAEYAEIRLKKFLRLREETLLTTYKPSFTPDNTEEYKEMYEMMAGSFRQNRDKVLYLLQLVKESLVDSPTHSTFMMWVSIAMMHSENYNQFKEMYDPHSLMRVDSSEYQALQDRYLSLNVPLGVKKIPVVFILFEIPRFYHYVDFLNCRLGMKKPRSFLTDVERARLRAVEEESHRLGFRRMQKTGMMVSPEDHLDFLTRKEEMKREKSCREKDMIKTGSSLSSSSTEQTENSKTQTTTAKTETPPVESDKLIGQLESSTTNTHKKKKKKKKKKSSSPTSGTAEEDGTQITEATPSPSPSASASVTDDTQLMIDQMTAKKLTGAPTDDPEGMPPHHPRVLSSNDFRSMLVEHLKANEATTGNSRKRSHPSTVSSSKPEVDPNSPLANVFLPPRPGKDPKSKPLVLPSEDDLPKDIALNRNSIRRARKDSRRAAKKSVRVKSKNRMTVLCTQVDTELLRARGFKVKGNQAKTTVLANKDGTIEHVLEGLNTAEEVRAYLNRKYNVLSQEAGSGYISMPSKNDPGALIIDPGCGLSLDENDVPLEPKLPGNPKKARKRAKQQQPASATPGTPFTQGIPAAPTSAELGKTAAAVGSDSNNDEKETSDHQFMKGFEKKALTAKDDEEVEKILNKALEPADLGDQLGPAPRYIVPFGAGKLKFPINENTTPEDLKEMIEEASKPTQQMRALDAMGIPYKLETTQVFRPALDDKGEEIPDAIPKLTLVSKITLLPKDGPKQDDGSIVELSDDHEESEEEETVNEDDKTDKEGKETATTPDQQQAAAPDPPPTTASSKSSKKKAKRKKKKNKSGTGGGSTHCSTAMPEDDIPEGQQPPAPAVPVRPIDDIDLDDSSVVTSDSKPRKTARDKFKTCENCGSEIVERILVCAGCKKVAYCNFRCQKANWKLHKKTCSYALKKDVKDCTG